MKTKRKGPVLKWRKSKNQCEYRAGPFTVLESDGLGLTYIKGFGDDGDDATGHAFASAKDAMRWCERLARQILKATRTRGARDAK